MAAKRRDMRTGLHKHEKTTSIFFDERSSTVEIFTHNTALRKRLQRYAEKYPTCCHQTEDDGQGGLGFEIEKGRFSMRLVPPYDEERRQRASQNAKEHGIASWVNGRSSDAGE